MEVPVLDKTGRKVGVMTVDEAELGGEVNPALLKQAYVRYHANTRQGSARTRNRGNVEGSTRKLYRQKGTGNARAGAVRTPIRKGGGRAFAKVKERESYRLDMPVKMRRKANRNALLAKLIDNEVKVFDDLSFSAPRTRDFEAMLKACGIDRSCLAALNRDNGNARLSAQNVERVTVCASDQLTCFEMLNHRFMIITKADLEAWLKMTSPANAKAKAARRKSAKEAA